MIKDRTEKGKLLPCPVFLNSERKAQLKTNLHTDHVIVEPSRKQKQNNTISKGRIQQLHKEPFVKTDLKKESKFARRKTGIRRNQMYAGCYVIYKK